MSWQENGQNNILWLTGHPGCGKTTISSTLAQHFKDNDEQSKIVLLHLCQNQNE